jgi:NitT/TauT family transport system substrate-binding protein
LQVARVAVPDLVSNSYFPAIAAVALGCFTKEGLNAQHRLIFPNYKAYEALREGEVDFVAGPAHVVSLAFPEWQGAKLLMALSQGMYWLLVMRSDLEVKPGDVNAVKGRTIGAAPLVELTFKQLLAENNVDLDRDQVRIVDVKRAHNRGVSFGVAAAEALADGQIDGFWANAMGAQNAIRSGVGQVVLDVRRGLGPKSAFHYTFPALVTSDKIIARDPHLVAAAVRAVVDAQRALVKNVSLAAKVGEKLFPAPEAERIVAVVERDLPYYRPEISDGALAGLVRFSHASGLLKASLTRDQMVASQFERYHNV